MADSDAPAGGDTDGKVAGNRRRRFVVPLLALLCIGAWPSDAIDTRALIAVLKDPLSIFADRSPGERAAGALTQTKPGHGRTLVRHAAIIPQERVLSATRTRAAPPIDTAEPGLPGTTIVSDVPTDGGSPLTGGVVDTPEAGGGGGGLPFFTPPTTNGPGIGVPGGSPENPVVTPPTAAVPEPQTWLTMMLGLLVIGGSLRRRRAIAARTTGDIATHQA